MNRKITTRTGIAVSALFLGVSGMNACNTDESEPAPKQQNQTEPRTQHHMPKTHDTPDKPTAPAEPDKSTPKSPTPETSPRTNMDPETDPKTDAPPSAPENTETQSPESNERDNQDYPGSPYDGSHPEDPNGDGGESDPDETGTPNYLEDETSQWGEDQGESAENGN